MNTPKTPIVEVKNVTKVYDMGKVQIRALNGVSISIHENEFLAIIGKSGSGKSTLMHILGLLDSPTAGEVLLNGVNTTNYSEKELAKARNKTVGFVFQSYNLLRRATALENVILPLQYSNVPRKLWRKKAEEILNLVELGDRMNNKSNELSGGQKQRVAIARSLVNDPQIIFADEPTGNLDTKTGDEITALFSKLNKEGKTVVLVTHDEDLANIAKRQILIRDGLIVGPNHENI